MSGTSFSVIFTRRMWLLSAVLVLTGCGGSEKPGGTPTPLKSPGDKPPSQLTQPTPPKRGKIGVSVLTMTNPFFKVIADTITSEANKYGFEVIVVSGDDNSDKQQNQVKDFLVAQCTAIVLCPCNSRAIGTAIKEANAKKVPVFTADIACLDPDAKVVSHIATDNYAGGQQAGEAMIEALGETGGKVLILDKNEVESCQLRVDGFSEVIKKYNADRTSGKIEVVDQLPGHGDKEAGFKCTEDALQTHSDLRGIFAINDPSALGALAALEKAGKAAQVKIVGFDGQPDGIQAIKEGKIFADPVQFPERIGKMTMEAIIGHLDGEKVPPVQLIPTGL